MNDSGADTATDDAALRAVASELMRNAPAPHSWESLAPTTAEAERLARRTHPVLLTIAAGGVVVAGVVGAMTLARNGSTSTPPAEERLPAVRPAGPP